MWVPNFIKIELFATFPNFAWEFFDEIFLLFFLR